MYGLRNFQSEKLTNNLNEIVASQTIEKQTGSVPSPVKNILT